jgi:hypothetical protein
LHKAQDRRFRYPRSIPSESTTSLSNRVQAASSYGRYCQKTSH